MVQRSLSPLTLWALAFGCCIGWGSFIMPGTTFLPTAGTAGTTIAILLGAPLMILIAYNYHFVMGKFSGAGGVFTFTREIFGLDHAFFCAWFLWIAYVSLLWANATAVTLMGRNLFGGVLQVGFHYEFAGYEVFGGEIFVTLLLLIFFAALFVKAPPVAKLLVKISAVALLIGVIFCYAATVVSAPEAPKIFFIDDKSEATQIFMILALMPWAFIGFETISQYTDEFPKNSRRAFALMVAAIICAAVVYILMTSLATLRFPEQFKSTAGYIGNLRTVTGIAGVPTFFAVTETFGGGGVWILCAVISCALITSMIGYYRAVGNLTQTFAREKILPQRLTSRRNAVLFVLALSLIVPFCGRTVIGWLTDVTTIGATIAYGYTSACAYVLARREKNRRVIVTGVAGIICAVGFTIFLLIPNLWSISVLAQESYFILAIWGLAGFAYFNFIFKRDEKFFGTAPTVWLVLFFLIFFSALMWMREKMYNELTIFIQQTNEFYATNKYAPRFAYTNMRIAEMRIVLLNNTMILLMFAIAGLGFLFSIYRRIQRKEMFALQEQKRRAEESSKAKSTFLSNMSHDIRTPMNAIIGYTTLAKRDDVTFAELRDFLAKIDVSGKHLLDLINDILEMSRIESGRMELEITDADLKKIFDDLQTMFRTQMETKGINFSVDASKIRHRHVLCDRNRFNRVLLNLVGNAYKFTPSGKSVAVTLAEIDDGNFELRVKDTGIGMSAEFAKKIFQAFERERTSTVSGIQGTGLGTAITKSIVDLMGGTIEVVTEKNFGTEFIVRVAFKIVDSPTIDDVIDEPEAADDFAGKKILLVEDIEVNREIAVMMLSQFGFEIDTAVNGREALDKATENKYDLILMDVQMPVMNGYESARAIRERGLTVPIVAMTANAMPEDIKRARAAGMNDHIAKPLDVPKMMATIAAVLNKF